MVINWQPIESAPKDGQYILVGRFGNSGDFRWAKHSRWISEEDAAEMEGGIPGDYDAGWSDGDDDLDYCYPTHWTFLPDPPASLPEEPR